MSTSIHFSKKTLNNELVAHTAVNPARCYQCGKCSAGCPLAENMDFTSNTIMRMIQSEDENLDKELLQSEAIWLCLSCEMCISRCPMQIDIPKIMDYLRQQSVAKGLKNKSADKNIVSFHRSFLDMVKTTGRSYEIGMIAEYKLRSKKFMQDLTLAPKMLIKGKLPIFPEMVKDKKNIQRIFNESKTGK